MLALLGNDVLEAVDAVLPLQGAGVTYVIDGAAHRLREDVSESGFGTIVVLSELHEPPSEVAGSSIARPPVELSDQPLATSRLAVIDQPAGCLSFLLNPHLKSNSNCVFPIDKVNQPISVHD